MGKLNRPSVRRRGELLSRARKGKPRAGRGGWRVSGREERGGRRVSGRETSSRSRALAAPPGPLSEAGHGRRLLRAQRGAATGPSGERALDRAGLQSCSRSGSARAGRAPAGPGYGPRRFDRLPSVTALPPLSVPHRPLCQPRLRPRLRLSSPPFCCRASSPAPCFEPAAGRQFGPRPAGKPS